VLNCSHIKGVKNEISDFISRPTHFNLPYSERAEQGGRMIGKKMSALLLDKKTLEFYKVRLAKKVYDVLVLLL
jgi:hypothetical protein